MAYNCKIIFANRGSLFIIFHNNLTAIQRLFFVIVNCEVIFMVMVFFNFQFLLFVIVGALNMILNERFAI